jgi:hypothetical protein
MFIAILISEFIARAASIQVSGHYFKPIFEILLFTGRKEGISSSRIVRFDNKYKRPNRNVYAYA